MPPYILEQFVQLHPYQQQKFFEILGWSGSGTAKGSQPSFSAYEKAILWAKQVEIPPPAPEEPMPGEE